MASSSLWCQFLLISVVAIGTLLMIVPDVHAFECYASRTKNASSSAMGGRAAWQLKKIFRIATGANDENPLEVSIAVGTPTEQCLSDYDWCSTVHCARLHGDYTVKKCARVTAGSQDPTQICQWIREIYAAGDPKFYCRFCNTDKCNDE